MRLRGPARRSGKIRRRRIVRLPLIRRRNESGLAQRLRDVGSNLFRKILFTHQLFEFRESLWAALINERFVIAGGDNGGNRGILIGEGADAASGRRFPAGDIPAVQYRAERVIL